LAVIVVHMHRSDLAGSHAELPRARHVPYIQRFMQELTNRRVPSPMGIELGNNHRGRIGDGDDSSRTWNRGTAIILDTVDHQ
jgi:hypothetical protein